MQINGVKKVLRGLCVLSVCSSVAFAADVTPLPPLPKPSTQNPFGQAQTSVQLTPNQQKAADEFMQQITQASAAGLLPNNVSDNTQNMSQNANNNANPSSEAPKANTAVGTGGIPHLVTAKNSTFGSVYDPAFQNILKRQFPLTPEQIKALREVFQRMERAKIAPIEVPTPTVSTRNVLLAPGTVPPVIKMAQGYVSSIVFLDETGQPWPIANFSVGNPNAFDIKWDSTSNILMIQGVAAYDTGNMAIRLVGLETPVMITMVNDQQQVDYRVDLRVQGRGPNARSSMIGGLIPNKPSNMLMDLLDGIPPTGAQRLTVPSGLAEAWEMNSTMYVRTRLTLLSPSWTGTMSSADGTKVYELSATPLLLASQHGQTVEIKVEGL